MSLPLVPPTVGESDDPLKLGSTGWGVYSIQTGLNYGGGESLSSDGNFGQRTHDAVVEFQRRWGLTGDGVAGARTKALIVERLALRVDRERPGLPDGLIRELARAEGGDNTCAVNPYDPSPSDQGTDCGVVQIRCMEPYRLEDLKRAFSPYHALVAAAVTFETRKAKFLSYGWTKNNRVRSERCALMSWNWPAGAGDIAFEGKLTRPDDPATWVPAGVKMLDGTVVNTRQEWVDHYAMGTYPHCGPAAARIKWGV